jgi:beta-glucosidase
MEIKRELRDLTRQSTKRLPINKLKGQLLRFPDNFLWGVSTSHFQIEGNPEEIFRRSSDWATWTKEDGKISDASDADLACDFYNRYQADIELCESLGIKTFRLSLNWAALCPSQNESFSPDNKSVVYYRKLLELLKEKGFTTFVTLFHFCSPSWLADIGGWHNDLVVTEFARFTELAVEHYGDLTDYWITINEPLAYAYQGYIEGGWPPGYKGNYLWAFGAIANMLKGHARAYQIIKRNYPNSKVSYSWHYIPFIPRNYSNIFDHVACYLRDRVFNHIFMKSIETGKFEFPFPLNLEKPLKAISGPIEGLKGSVDYLALNYYTRQICHYNHTWPPDIFGVRSDITEYDTSGLGWEIFPKGLYDLLTKGISPYRFDARRRPREVYITENGLANIFPAELTEGDWSLNDEARVNYLRLHLQAIYEAIKAGVNVKGYLYWSLLDNFEWAEGLKARFGLVRVAFPTQERTLRKSAKVYSEIAKSNSVKL